MSDDQKLVASLPSEGEGWRKTSDAADSYNCIAWALGENDIRYDYASGLLGHWPRRLPRNSLLTTWIELFRRFRYDAVDSEPPIEAEAVIAIFAHGNVASHAARRLPNGRWTSKAGIEIDLEHDLSVLEGGDRYGRVAVFMVRR